ncbi:hypothetical protein QNM97_22415 [Gordonia sp. L191]|nr:hypothetical protein [Gordonia sp. L191]WHU46697.1 hypothetical protein QNM97_22415 [Gordonia sp. L191]
MKLAETLHGPRRPARLGALSIRRPRRQARMFPAEAERLITAAELRRLHG